MTRNFTPVEEFTHRVTNQVRTPVAGIAIAIDGQLHFTHIAGQATPNTPASDDTLWPLASISKLYTASAIMSLVEEGRMGLWTKP
jgi:CubicO group peptidase (beta-lactamase class C family)